MFVPLFAGRTAATDEESNFDPDEDDGSVSPPRRHVQNQAASDTESPERPVSPQKGEARAAFRRPASPEPAPEAASAAQPPASPGKPSSPVKPASPERPEVYAGRSHAAGSRQAAARSPPPERAAKISMPDELTTAADSHKPAQAAQLSAGNMIVEGTATLSGRCLHDLQISGCICAWTICCCMLAIMEVDAAVPSFQAAWHDKQSRSAFQRCYVLPLKA